MLANTIGKMTRALISFSLVVVGFSGSLYADETEIFRPAYRPNILIVFDDSGSMSRPTENANDGSRLVVAKQAITTVIKENPGIDFGLVLFNRGYDNINLTYPVPDLRRAPNKFDGGRIVNRILKNDDAMVRDIYREDLFGVVDQIKANGSTPLCESTYEAYLYLAGEKVFYGDDGAVNHIDKDAGGSSYTDLPDRDKDAESGGKYIAPTTYCAETYIIIITDGAPQNDTQANEAIKKLIGEDPEVYKCVPSSNASGYPTLEQGYQENCLPELAEYMATTDLVEDPTTSNQIAITYTIGFTITEEQALLMQRTADLGRGTYTLANNAAQLANALGDIVGQVEAKNATLTSPSVAVDSFTQTRSRDDVIFSMFTPLASVDWPGNIKKLKVDLVDGFATLVNDDEPPTSVIDSDGAIKPGASTFWSFGDGGEVTKGGVGELLLARDPAVNPRDLWTNSGEKGALEEFDSTSLDADAYGSQDQLFTAFGVDEQATVEVKQAQVNAAINWGKGYEVADDGSVIWPDPSDADYAADYPDRWILADMLNSQPLVVNYGATGSDNVEDGTDLRILVGTNAGFLHMFGNKDGEEDWAFFPKELASVLTRRAANEISADHVYGIDASPVLYTRDLDRDGTIEAEAGDKAWVFFGLRRGGSMMYALDISDPDEPEFMWRIDETSTGFGELGQTWSDPVVTRIPGYFDNKGAPKPVLIFGAGYDDVNKDGSGIATPDSKGRGMYIVDAEDGSLVWGVTPAADSGTNLEADGLEHSVAAMVTPLDSNGDGLTDRIYFADTGGNVWRVDLPGNCRPGDDKCQSDDPPPWSIFKLAEMNGGTVATDRRFFNAPDIVRTSAGGVNFEAVLIGSGDVTNPNATDNEDQFYMIRDLKVNPYFNTLDESKDCDKDPPAIDDFRCDLPLGPGDLYDVLGNLLELGDTDQQTSAAAALANGWRLDLNARGEKSMSKSITIAGTVYFGTFSPEANMENVCTPETVARLYGVSLYSAAAAVDFDDDETVERSWIIGTLPPDTPSTYIDEDGQIWLLLPPGSGSGIISNPFLTGASIAAPRGTYWYREEY